MSITDVARDLAYLWLGLMIVVFMIATTAAPLVFIWGLWRDSRATESTVREKS